MASSRPRVLRDPWRIRAAMAAAGAPLSRVAWRGPYCVVVGDGPEPTIVVARAGVVSREPFLLLETNRAGDTAPGVFHRLILALIRRLARETGLPVALVVDAAHTGLARAMADVHRLLPGVTVYPGADHNVVSLRVATMARRLGHVIGMGPIVALDLRPEGRDAFGHAPQERPDGQMLLLIQSFNRLFGSAPTWVAAGLPSLNRISVGMPRTA